MSTFPRLKLPASASCTERLAVVDSHKNITHTYDDLLRLSHEKTNRLKKELGYPGLKMEDFKIG
jgi:hypothetical protein